MPDERVNHRFKFAAAALFGTLFLTSAACSFGGNTVANTAPTLRPAGPTLAAAKPPTVAPRTTAAASPSAAASNVGLGKVLFQDDFHDTASGWVTADLGESKFGYLNGEYQIVLKKANLNSHALLPNHKFDNVSIETDARFVTGPNSSVFGIICRATANTVLQTGYEFLITADGGYGILKVTGPNAGQSHLVGPEGKSSAVHTGSATNHLRADCSGNSLALYVNGQKLVAGQDGDFKDGQAGFGVSTPANDPGYEVHFDNFIVRELIP